MQSPLVVFIPERERDALRSSGVLPPSWYEMCGRALWHGAGDRVYLWPHAPDYENVPAAGGVPPPPAQLLGLETKGDEGLRSENLVAKLFGATVLHVLFLDDVADGTPGLADTAPLLKLLRWVRGFGESVRAWFADTQNRNIRHVAVVVARKGAFHLSEEQLKAFRDEFTDNGAVRTCYLINARLEVGLGHDALHATYLWPVIVGRLILRILIELSMDDPSGGIFLPGVHLIRSFEYLIECPEAEAEGLKKETRDAVYQVIHEAPEGAVGDGGQSHRPQVVNREVGVFPGLPESLSSYARQRPENKAVDWYREDIAEFVASVNDDSRWIEARDRARTDFAARERKQFLEKEPDRVMEAREIFRRVAKDPGNITREERSLKDKLPSDTYGKDVIYEKWQAMVRAERARKKAQRDLETAGGELVRAQNHYVTAPYGIMAVVAASIFCGFALVRLLWSVAGDGSLLVAMVLSALSMVGAVFAWLAVAWFHRRAGIMAMGELRDLAEKVDANMDVRHAAAVNIVRAAETRHTVGLRRGAIAVLQRLLARVGRIVGHELQSPTPGVFYQRPEEAGADVPSPRQSADGEGRREELAVFCARTRFSHELTCRVPDMNGHNRSPHVEKVIVEAFRERGEKSFRAFWERLCAETDGLYQQGNYPAQIFVPRIREWFRSFGGRLVMAQKLDLVASAEGATPGRKGMALPTAFGKLSLDRGFALASADVESAAVKEEGAPRMVFVPKAAKLLDQAKKQLESGGGDKIFICETSVLDGLPQAAFFFQDIRVNGIGRDTDGRLLFLSRNGEPVRSRSESGVA